MARTQIPVQTIAGNGGSDVDVAFTAGDDANEMYFLNTGRELLLIRTGTGAVGITTIDSVEDENGRTGDKAITVAASKIAAAGPFPPKLFNQRASADFGRVFVDIDDDTDLEYAVVSFTPGDR